MNEDNRTKRVSIVKNKKSSVPRGKQKFKMKSIFFEREEERRETVKNLDEMGIKNGTMLKLFWKTCRI